MFCLQCLMAALAHLFDQNSPIVLQRVLQYYDSNNKSYYGIYQPVETQYRHRTNATSGKNKTKTKLATNCFTKELPFQ